MKNNEAMELKSGLEMMNEPSPYDGITYKITDKYLLIFKNKRAIYNIHKDRCLTREKQFDWIAHMCVKIWVSPYEFVKHFYNALEEWGI